MVDRATETGARAGLLLVVPAIVAWMSGFPFVFPSLGPTAYLMATEPSGAPVEPRRVVGGHLVGVIAGLVAYHLLAPDLVVTAVGPALADEQLRLAASAITSVVLTTGGMHATDTNHAPACATTLIISLGLLSTLLEATVVVAAVILLSVTHLALRPRFGGSP